MRVVGCSKTLSEGVRGKTRILSQFAQLLKKDLLADQKTRGQL